MTQLLRYAIHAVAGFAINVALLAVLVDVLSLPAALAPILSLAITWSLTFFLADRWVFTDRDGPLTHRFTAYVSVLIGAKAASYVGYLGLLYLDVHYLAAWLLASITIFILSYRTHRRTREAIATDPPRLTDAIRRLRTMLEH